MSSLLNFTFQNSTAKMSEKEWQSLQGNLHPDLFEGVYSSKLCNCLMLCLYCLVGLSSCVALMIISWFEKSGQAGHYRTLANQLISMKLDQMVLGFVFGLLVFVIRPFTGPMPEWTCRISNMIIIFCSINICLLAVSVVGTRFAFAFLYKSLPVMDDKLMARLIYSNILLWSFLATLAKFYIEQTKVVYERICSGTWSQFEEEGLRVPLAMSVATLSFVIHTAFSIALWFKSKSKDKVTKLALKKAKPSNLASSLATIMSTTSFFSMTIVLMCLTRYAIFCVSFNSREANTSFNGRQLL